MRLGTKNRASITGLKVLNHSSIIFALSSLFAGFFKDTLDLPETIHSSVNCPLTMLVVPTARNEWYPH